MGEVLAVCAAGGGGGAAADSEGNDENQGQD